MITLSQKEESLLNELSQHEELCIEKYTNYAQKAQDPQLAQLFQSLAQKEQQHYDSVQTLLQGQIPQNAQGGGQQGQSQQGSGQQGQSQGQGQGMQGQQNQSGQMSQQQGSQGSQQSSQSQQQNNPDSSLLEDMLMTEKYVSSYYDTAVFEMSNSQVRQVLQHIQQEEQQHGEEIYNYMSEKGLYN
ncbi:spore coat protein [Proteinivorax hydrogeniformans]|uniref:Spore coat protein n=1 Tax=Proteinivorax hydrogeniformans TaxID=1826727 RepID=A0AAU8HVW7_9FIRM